MPANADLTSRLSGGGTILRRLAGGRGIALAGAILLAGVLLHLGTGPAAAAEGDEAPSAPRARTNPLSRDPAAVLAGRSLYLARCAVCHGQDAKGSMAANLVRSRSVARGTDAALFRLLVQGIPGTEMPPQEDLEEPQVWQVVSFLHSLARPGLQPPVAGDIEDGLEVFRTAGCSECHSVDGEGGFWGPALDSIATRKTSENIRRDVLEPSSEVLEGYRSVTARTAGGEPAEGLLKNADTFSIQILRRDGTYSLLDRGQVTELIAEEGSVMPADYEQRLSGHQLQNLLAFLDRQRDAFVTIVRGFQNY